MKIVKFCLFIITAYLMALPCCQGGNLGFVSVPYGSLYGTAYSDCQHAGVNITHTNFYDSNLLCIPQGFNPSRSLFYKGMSFGGEEGSSVWPDIDMAVAYVPITGMYAAKLHFCPMKYPGDCYMKNATLTTQTGWAEVSSEKPIDRQFIVDSPAPRIRPNATGNICLTIVSEKGAEWRIDQPMFCKDAAPFPVTPADCYINYNSDLNVDMGKLSKNDLATTPGVSSKIIVKKIPVLCSRDAATTVKTSFKYTPLSIASGQIIKSSINGLGIAIHYRNNIVKLNDEFTESFAQGSSVIEIGFEPVRDPAVKVTDLATGDFNANAVMIMNEQ